MTEDNNSGGGLERFAKGETDHSTDDEHCVWLGMEFIIPDKRSSFNPDEMESDIREWVSTFLREGLQNIDYESTGRGTDLLPRADGWSENPLFVRYKDEYWFDNPDKKTGRRRMFGIWFPVQAFFEHHQLDVVKEKMNYLIGDEVYENYGQELEVRGILIAGSEDQVRNHMTHSFDDVEFENHL